MLTEFQSAQLQAVASGSKTGHNDYGVFSLWWKSLHCHVTSRPGSLLAQTFHTESDKYESTAEYIKLTPRLITAGEPKSKNAGQRKHSTYFLFSRD